MLSKKDDINEAQRYPLPERNQEILKLFVTDETEEYEGIEFIQRYFKTFEDMREFKRSYISAKQNVKNYIVKNHREPDQPPREPSNRGRKKRNRNDNEEEPTKKPRTD